MASLSVRSGGGGDRNTMGRAFFVVWEPAGPEQGKVVVEVCISGRGANPGSPTTGACMRRVGRNRRRSRSACTTCIYSRRWRRGRGAACPGWRRRPSDGRPSPGRCRSGTARRHEPATASDPTTARNRRTQSARGVQLGARAPRAARQRGFRKTTVAASDTEKSWRCDAQPRRA